MKLCPCGTEKEYRSCCERFISGQQAASTPEELMRSRYTAYSMANMTYIAETMTGPASQHFEPTSTAMWAKKVSWQGLKVIRAMAKENAGLVEFIASYREDDKLQEIHEISQFERIDGKWFYTDGTAGQTKVGRNELCRCGSQKKYKKCCGMKER